MTVLARIVRATPHRSSNEAWDVIVGLLAPQGGAAKAELLRVVGIAASLITSEAPKNEKMVVWGGGPRVRISCIYDDEAIADDNHREAELPRSASDGDW